MNFKKILLIYNSKSGRGNGAKIAKKIKFVLQQKGMFADITSPLTIDELDQMYRNLSSEYEAIVIVGGDGTLSLNVNFMLKNNINLPIYAFGKGTANDVAKYFKTNASYKNLKKYFNKKYIHKCDLIQCDDGFAVSVVAGGAFTNGVVKYDTKLKKIFGKIAYLCKAIDEIFVMKHQKVEFDVDGKVFCEDCYCFFVTNTKNVGGIKNIASLARHNDEKLDLVIIKKCSFFKRIGIMFSLIFQRMHKNKNIGYHTGKKFSILPKGKVIKKFSKTDLDGNAGGNFPLHAEVSKKYFKIISPI